MSTYLSAAHDHAARFRAQDAGRRAAWRLWRRLLDEVGREFTLPANCQCVVGADPLLDAIDELEESAGRGDPSRIHLLIGHGFLKTDFTDNGRTLTYRLVHEEPEPDTRSWTEFEQARLDRLAAQEREAMDREFEARERAAKTLREPFEALERAKVAQGLQHPDVAEVLRRLIHDEVEATLDRRRSAAA